MTIFDLDVDVTQNRDHRLAVDNAAITGGHFLYFDIGYITRMLIVHRVTHAGLWRRLYRRHQALGVGMLGIVDDLFGRALFLNLARIQHDNMIGNLRHHRQVVGHVNGG